MDEARVSHKKTAEKQTGILTPGQAAQKIKGSQGCLLFKQAAEFNLRGA
jgi:hypothetical protein